MSDSDLVEVLKRSGSFRKNWGLLFGAFFFNRAINAATGRRPRWWTAGIAVATAAVGFLVRHTMPGVFG